MREHSSLAQLGLGLFLILFRRRRRRRGNVAGRLCQTSVLGIGLVVVLRAGCAFSVGSRAVRSLRILADLALKIFFLVGGIEHVFVSDIRQDFSSIAEKNNSSCTTDFWGGCVESRVELIGAIVELVVDAGTAELS